MNTREPGGAGQETELESWKEIAAYLGRQVKTVQRWEKEERLPVHRHSHKSRSSVYAYASEIDTWKASRRVAPEPAPARPLWRLPAFAATIILCLVMVGNGIRPVSAQQPGAAKAARQVWVTRSSDTPLSVSPDGRTFAFTDWHTGDLAVHDLTTGADRRLTNGGAEAEAAVFSADGRQIAYNWFPYKEPHNEEVLVIPVAGGSPRRLWTSEATGDYLLPAGWSPDGKQLLVMRGLPDRTSQLALLSIQDGSMRSLKSFGWQDFSASFSPDGKLIAYDSVSSTTSPARDIFVLAADGSRETAVVQNPANDAQPIWSPDGSRILFLSDRTGRPALWSVPLVNGKPGKEELVKADVNSGRIFGTTESGALYYMTPGVGGPNIYSAELSADMKVSKAPALAVNTFVNSNNGPALSPDGEFLAYGSRRTGSDRALVIRTLKTGEERLVPSQFPLASIFGIGPRWFPDGRSLLIMSSVPQGPGPSFYRIDVDSGKAELLFRSQALVSNYKLSPDGKTVFYTEEDRLVRFDVETRRETELKKVEQLHDVALSPDGKQLAYVASPGDGSYIAVMPAAGGPAREVFRDSRWYDGSRLNSVSWTPDQSYLLFSKHDGVDSGPTVLWRVPVAGGAAEQMGLSMPRLNSPQVHPDGRRLFFVANESGPAEVWALENFLPAARAAK